MTHTQSYKHLHTLREIKKMSVNVELLDALHFQIKGEGRFTKRFTSIIVWH